MFRHFAAVTLLALHASNGLAGSSATSDGPSCLARRAQQLSWVGNKTAGAVCETVLQELEDFETYSIEQAALQKQEVALHVRSASEQLHSVISRDAGVALTMDEEHAAAAQALWQWLGACRLSDQRLLESKVVACRERARAELEPMAASKSTADLAHAVQEHLHLSQQLDSSHFRCKEALEKLYGSSSTLSQEVNQLVFELGGAAQLAKLEPILGQIETKLDAVELVVSDSHYPLHEGWRHNGQTVATGLLFLALVLALMGALVLQRGVERYPQAASARVVPEGRAAQRALAEPLLSS
mmetsp:Transcript_16468/g.37036  ORF Transcript_16468/g.37036 Transcript_16468/m.37036 type:complete len:298 (-) Transcript_16468:23-916(-)